MINLYSVGNENFNNNGDATLQVISATVHKIINGMWILEATIPYDEEGRYKLVDDGCMLRINDSSVSEVASVQIWRIYKYRRNTKNVWIMAFPRAMEANYDAPISQLILSNDVTGASAASSLSNESQKYTVQSNVTNQGRSEWNNTNLIKAISGTDENSFVNVWGGEVVYDNLTIKILDGIGNSENVVDVMYGKNIEEISYEVDDSGLVTRIYPLSSDGIRYWDEEEDVEYVDSPKIEDYPLIHCAYLTTPYTLVDDDANEISRTAKKTQDIKSRIQAKASQLSHSIWNTAVSNGWKIDYMASISKDIIANIQAMVTNNIAHEGFVKVVNAAVSAGMAWMADEEDPEWHWIEDQTDAWKYGNTTSGRYAHNEWQYIDKKWRWFGDDYYWQEPKDDDSTWTWYENQTTHKKWYGTQDRYYLKGQYIYITENGDLTKYWLDGDGWYDSDKTDVTDWEWHYSEEKDAWWFGKEDSETGEAEDYMSGQWAFIDGTLYWFDDEGWYYGVKEEHPPFDWMESGEAFWFGNPDHTTRSYWLASQWAYIEGEWYRFDSSGYTEDIHSECLTLFHNGMGGSGENSLTTLVQTCKDECYELLYDLMEEWCEKQYDDGLDSLKVTINVNMVDLSKTADYADYQALETVHLGDTVRCVDYVHNIATIERVIELTYDLVRGYNTSVTIGVANSTVGSMLSGSTGGGSASNNAINVEFIEQSLAQKQQELVAGQNVTLTDNLDGTQTIASDKLIRAGRNMEVIHNPDGSDTLNAEGGALEYWVEENTKLYRKKEESVSNTFGWDCDSDFKFVNDGVHYAFYTNGSVVAPLTHYEETNTEAACYGFAMVNGTIHAIGISAQSLVFLHIYFSGNCRTYDFTYNGVQLYYASADTHATSYNDLVWQEYGAFGGPPTTGRHFPMISGEYTSIEDARDALIQQAHFFTKKVYYTGESIDGQVIWGGVLHGVGDLSNVTPSQMQFYVTNEGIVEGKGYKINGVDLYNIFQQILIAGDNIQIAADGKTISATDTTYTAGTNVQISAQNVISATDTDELSELSDVAIDDQTLANGQILKWDSTSSKWVNGAGGSGSANIVELTETEYENLPVKVEDTVYFAYQETSRQLDPNYTYYKYGDNDEIIVRVYHEGESDQEVLWFFNGWSATALDNAIPSELNDWKPTNTQPIYSDSYAVEGGSQTSWLGFYGGGIRSWSLDLTSGYIGIIHAVVNPFPTSAGQQTNGYYDPYVYIENEELTVRMTSNTSTSGTASDYGALSSAWLPWHAFATETTFNAYVNGEYWAGNGQGAYLQFDFADIVNISKVAFASYGASSFDLEYSTDGTTYQTAETLTQTDQGTPYPTKQDYVLSSTLENVKSVRFVCNGAYNLGCVHLYGAKAVTPSAPNKIYLNGKCYVGEMPYIIMEDGVPTLVYDDGEE